VWLQLGTGTPRGEKWPHIETKWEKEFGGSSDRTQNPYEGLLSGAIFKGNCSRLRQWPGEREREGEERQRKREERDRLGGGYSRD
jgi:hypothetical protein